METFLIAKVDDVTVIDGKGEKFIELPPTPLFVPRQYKRDQPVVLPENNDYQSTIDYDTFFKAFSERYDFTCLQDLQPLLRDTISLVRIKKSDDNIPLGASKFGGSPDLPSAMNYPYYNADVPYTFIKQINCREMASFDQSSLLPKTGMLYFFHAFEDGVILLPHDLKGDLSGFQKSVHVFHFDGDENQLVRTPVPKSDHIEKIGSAEVRFVSSLTIRKPFENEDYYKSFGFAVDDDEMVDEACTDLQSVLPRLVYEGVDAALDGSLDECYDRPFHQLLGEPEYFQGPPHEELSYEVREIFSEPGIARETWILFDQLWDDDGINLKWAADGVMYYYIRLSDLQNKRFDRLYPIMQCG
jgi:uncharacterized protein YwqG